MLELVLYGIPWLLFLSSFYLLLKSNVIPFYHEKGLYFDPKKNRLGITIKTMKKTLREPQTEEVEKELGRMIRLRRWHFACLGLSFFWTFMLGLLNR